MNKLNKQENQNTEFKESLKLLKEIGETISAFANSGRGTVYIGISDKGKIIDIDIKKNTIENLTNHIKANTDSKIYPEIQIKEIMEYIGKNQRITTKECANLFGFSSDTAQRELFKLRLIRLLIKKALAGNLLCY
ncbi:MAG: hypothetical protein B6U87_01175 [Candidatus Aenigmarchaeota archaeon ex4484_52]|nr:MAG: hypothetical protein B6U87_01175 [Candidatus Aenigmarchaeota archaeon ex4484_52]